jgi:hypothetical protein
MVYKYFGWKFLIVYVMLTAVINVVAPVEVELLQKVDLALEVTAVNKRNL